MTKFINASIVAFSVFFAGLGSYAYFAPRPGHEASVVSLIAGVAIAVLMMVSLYLWTKNPRAGRIMSLVLCLLCLGRFVPAWLSKGFYPNGLMAVMALALTAILGMGHMMTKKA